MNNRISQAHLESVLINMGYHKVQSFVDRCLIETDDELGGLLPQAIKDVAWSMLDRDLERELLLALNIPHT